MKGHRILANDMLWPIISKSGYVYVLQSDWFSLQLMAANFQSEPSYNDTDRRISNPTNIRAKAFARIVTSPPDEWWNRAAVRLITIIVMIRLTNLLIPVILQIRSASEFCCQRVHEKKRDGLT